MALQITYTTNTNLIEKIIEVADPVVEDVVISQLPEVATVTATPIVVTSGTTTVASGVSAVVSAPVDETQTTIPITSVSGIFNTLSGVATIGTEKVYFGTVVADYGVNPTDFTIPTYTLSGVVRGWEGTTPATYASGVAFTPTEWHTYSVNPDVWDYTMITGSQIAVDAWRASNYAPVYSDASRSMSHKVWTSNKTVFSGSSQFTEFKNLEIEDQSYFEVNVPSGTLSGVSNTFVGVEFPIERTTKYFNFDLLPDVSGKPYIATDSGTLYWLVDGEVFDSETYNDTITGSLTAMYFGYSQDNVNWNYLTPSGVDENDGSTLYNVSDNIDDIDAYIVDYSTSSSGDGELWYVVDMLRSVSGTGAIPEISLWDFKDKFRAKYYKAFFTNYDMGAVGSGELYTETYDMGDGNTLVLSGTYTMVSGGGADAYDVFLTNLEILQSESGYDVRTATVEVDRPTSTASDYWRSTGSSAAWSASGTSGLMPTITGTWNYSGQAGSQVSSADGNDSRAIIDARFYCNSESGWECEIYQTVSGTDGTVTSGTLVSEVSPIPCWVTLSKTTTYEDGAYVHLKYGIRYNGTATLRKVVGEGVRYTA